MLSVIYLAVANDAHWRQWWNQFNIFVYILSFVIIFSLRLWLLNLMITGCVLVLGWYSPVLCSLSILVFSSSFGIPVCSSLSMMVSVRFSICSFFSFFESVPLSHLLFFSKCLLTVSVTANLPSKNIICPSSVLIFFIKFSVSSFCFFTCSSRFVWRSSSDISGFRHLKGIFGVHLFGLLFSLV